MSATARVRAAYAAIEEAARPEIWITLRPLADALAEAEAVDASERPLPLAGLVAAVKNNIDVAGIATTAACPGYADGPASDDATVVARLREAGAVIIGATNLDQFATGLVGTRSPHGAVRDARRPDHISGGSSSGSAVAVALGLVDIALGTDTAGSGRVPAALQGIGGFPQGVGSGEDLLTWARLSCMGDIPFGTQATAVYMAPPVSPGVRASVVRRPASPDVVAQGLLRLAVQHPQKAASIDRFLGLWWRIRAMGYLELNQRGASLRSLCDAARVSGLQKRDLVCMALCALPQGARTQVLAHGRGYRRA